MGAVALEERGIDQHHRGSARRQEEHTAVGEVDAHGGVKVIGGRRNGSAKDLARADARERRVRAWLRLVLVGERARG